jgi:DNA-binding XRE family transcriptional regulator
MSGTPDNTLAYELEDMEDQRDAVTFMLARMEQANDEARPWQVVERLHAGEHPVAVLRDPRHVSREDLASSVGAEPAVIEAIETYQQEGKPRLMLDIAHALRVDLDDLVPWAKDRDETP